MLKGCRSNPKTLNWQTCSGPNRGGANFFCDTQQHDDPGEETRAQKYGKSKKQQLTKNSGPSWGHCGRRHYISEYTPSSTSNISWILLNISLFLDSWLMEFSLGKIRRPAARRRAGNATRIFSLIFLITLSFETFNSQTFLFFFKLPSPGNAIQWSESGRKFSHGGIRPGGDVFFKK